MKLFSFPSLSDQPQESISTEVQDGTPAKRVNLHSYGYEKAEHHRGNALALENLFNQIRHGFIIDENLNEDRRTQQRAEIETKITDLQKEIETARTKIRTTNDTQIPALNRQIESLEAEILDLRKQRDAGPRQADHLDRFKFGLYSTLFVLISIFVFFFYVSSFYSAFYRDINNEAQLAEDSGQSVTAIISAIFVNESFKRFDFHWLGPLLLFAFGGFLHILYEKKTLFGRILLVGMLSIILLTDGLLAYFIEEKSFNAKVMMGMADIKDHKWIEEPVFYLVIMMGFVACLVWSGILHALTEEIGKKNGNRMLGIEIAVLKKKKAELVSQIAEFQMQSAALEGSITTMELEIKQLKENQKILIFSKSELEKYITDFYDGWLEYVNNRLHNDSLREECDAIRKAFYSQYINDTPLTIAA